MVDQGILNGGFGGIEKICGFVKGVME
jgi:hypothetical protein